jgi:hypothetical protein
MVDVVNEANLTLLAKALFFAAIIGAFGGSFQKVEPVIKVPLTRVIDVDGRTYEVGYDITAQQSENSDWSNPRVSMKGQPRLAVWGYDVQGPKVDLDVPQPFRSNKLFLYPKLY